MKVNKILLALAFIFVGGTAWAQGSLEDYQRAYSMRQKYGMDKVLNLNVMPQWIEGTHSFWYLQQTPQGRNYLLVDADKKGKKELFSPAKLATALSNATKKEVKADEMMLERMNVSKDFDQLKFDYGGHRWTYAVKKNILTDEGALPPRPQEKHWMEIDEEKDGDPVTSPDGKYIAFIKNQNVYVKELATGKEKELSIDGTLSNYYSVYIKWSPDSKKVAANKIRPVQKRYVYYVESSPADQSQPKLHKQEYAKPGDELPFYIPCIFDVETGKATIPSTELFSNQYSLNGNEMKWNDDSKAITFEYNQRGHQVYRILELSAETGKVRPLVEETSDKYVNYARYFRHDLKDGKRLIWMSERDNYEHLYMYDRASGKPLYQITKGDWYVRQVLKVDEEKELIYFTANGIQKNEDPYFIRYYRIGFDGKGMTDLTPETGMHRAWFSEDMKYLVDTYSMVDKAPETVLRDASNGKVIMPIEKADISKLLAEGWKAPEVFVAKGRDGKTDMWGLIQRPTNFDPNKKYPIIEYIYQGPGSQYVPKTFRPFDYYMTPIAELGFIVVMVDGMGTSFRSREFENICYKNLKDAGLPDHIAWIKAAAEKYPYMDIDKVGIYGCSAGGQESTAAVLFHPEFYKCAYSACGCHDNRMDKIWWNELWMSYPIGEQYKESSNVDNAHLLSRPLMLVVGELDDNVDPASTMQVANALIKANKDFELVVIPGAHHTVGEAFGEHKRYDFFIRNLWGTNPPKWSELEQR